MVTRLKKHKPFPIPDELQKTLLNIKFVFNSSFVIYRNVSYMALRMFDETSQTILAIIYVWEDENTITKINLSEYFHQNLDIIKVADPKMFIMNNEVCCTFNTGDATEKQNEIVLLKIDKHQITEYFVCNYAQRARTEKNWAFYVENNTLYSLYSLSPLTILKASETGDHTIIFEKFFVDENQYLENFSIGTPLLELDDGYGFIAHKKFFRKRKRLYLGKPCRLIINTTPTVKTNRHCIIHSLKSLLGAKYKFNKNLISCTYFSGIHRFGENLIISYGINDIDWNIVTIKLKKIWP
ncbi:hypothetical protein [Psychroserpens jangbogonensis]|uniref:hypothetical protein n=1 Tax=Psychroserpens jangbogonensis TaxID=1484460 RepID=UPI00053DA8BD|nr:hypothetical protein [Psychroserpens jangbogonensis]